MPPPVMQFQPQSVEPFQIGANTAAQQIQNQYAPGLLQQQLQEASLNNRLLAAKAQYAAPMAQAQLAQAQSEPQLTAAQAAQANSAAALSRAHTAILQGSMPYLIQQEAAKLFSDPMMQRAWELQQAQKYGVDTTALQNTFTGNGSNPNGGANASPINPLRVSTNSVGNSGTGNGYFNYLAFGSPINPFQMEQLKHQAATQGSTNVNQYTDALSEAQKEGQEGNELNLSANQFGNAYAHSYYKGGVLGNTSTTGWEGALARGWNWVNGRPTNMSAEQEADKAGNNLTLDLTKAQNLGRFTNQELGIVKNSNPNRTLDAGAEQQLVNLVQQKAVRMQEKMPFLNAAQKSGIDEPTAQTLWNMYNIQRPVYDFKNDKPNTQYINSYKDYLTPQMVQAARSAMQGNPQGTTSPQTQPPASNNDNSNLMKPLPLTQKQQNSLKQIYQSGQGQTAAPAANQSKYTNADIAYTAQKYHMTITQVRQRMQQMGVG